MPHGWQLTIRALRVADQGRSRGGDVDQDAALVADYPRVVTRADHRRVAGAELGLFAVIHPYGEPPGDDVAVVRDLARVGSGARLDVG